MLLCFRSCRFACCNYDDCNQQSVEEIVSNKRDSVTKSYVNPATGSFLSVFSTHVDNNPISANDSSETFVPDTFSNFENDDPPADNVSSPIFISDTSAMSVTDISPTSLTDSSLATAIDILPSSVSDFALNGNVFPTSFPESPRSFSFPFSSDTEDSATHFTDSLPTSAAKFAPKSNDNSTVVNTFSYPETNFSSSSITGNLPTLHSGFSSTVARNNSATSITGFSSVSIAFSAFSSNNSAPFVDNSPTFVTTTTVNFDTDTAPSVPDNSHTHFVDNYSSSATNAFLGIENNSASPVIRAFPTPVSNLSFTSAANGFPMFVPGSSSNIPRNFSSTFTGYSSSTFITSTFSVTTANPSSNPDESVQTSTSFATKLASST